MKILFSSALAGERVALAAVVIPSFLLMQVFGYIFNIRPILADAERLKVEKETQQERLLVGHHDLGELLSQKFAFKNDLMQLQSQADLMSFSRNELVLADIAEQGRLHGLHFSKLELGVEESLESFQRSILHFELLGDYQSMNNFVLSTSEKYPNFVFEKVTIKRSGLKIRPLSMLVMSYLYHPKMNESIDG